MVLEDLYHNVDLNAIGTCVVVGEAESLFATETIIEDQNPVWNEWNMPCMQSAEHG